MCHERNSDAKLLLLTDSNRLIGTANSIHHLHKLKLNARIGRRQYDGTHLYALKHIWSRNRHRVATTQTIKENSFSKVIIFLSFINLHCFSISLVNWLWVRSISISVVQLTNNNNNNMWKHKTFYQSSPKIRRIHSRKTWIGTRFCGIAASHSYTFNISFRFFEPISPIKTIIMKWMIVIVISIVIRRALVWRDVWWAMHAAHLHAKCYYRLCKYRALCGKWYLHRNEICMAK